MRKKRGREAGRRLQFWRLQGQLTPVGSPPQVSCIFDGPRVASEEVLSDTRLVLEFSFIKATKVLLYITKENLKFLFK